MQVGSETFIQIYLEKLLKDVLNPPKNTDPLKVYIYL